MKTNSNIMQSGIIILLLFCLQHTQVIGQSTALNYIHTKTMLDAAGTTSMQRIDYYDGLGRLVQTVQKAASPTSKDIITWQEYDRAGRDSTAWLPVSTGGTGAYVATATLKSASNTFYGDASAHHKSIFELSPLDRMAEQYGPGAAWRTAGRSVKTAYLANGTGELACNLYKMATDNVSVLTTGTYAANELFVTKTTDEDLKVTYTFTDKQGQTILKRAMNGSTKFDTYYVYDDYGNLRYVLPPAAADVLTTVNVSWNTTNNQTLKDYAFYYLYDTKNRLIQKKLPGTQPVSLKYDMADRLIFSQDGNQSGNRWTFYFYDVFGRQTVKGIWKSNTVPVIDNLTVKTDYTGAGTLAGYTVNLTLAAVDLLEVTYFDNYSFAATIPQLAYITPPTGYGSQFSSTKRLATGGRLYQVNDPAKYTMSTAYYDDRGRVVQAHAANHMGGYEDEFMGYTFTGKLKQRQHLHSATGKATQTEVYTYGYDHAERLLSVTHKMNTAAAVALATNTYDETGRLKTKKLGTETATYNYNVRSWLTQLTGTKFNQTLTYNAAVNNVTPSTATYNGNISAMKWKAGDEATERGYKFTYDGVNRMTSSVYGEGASLTLNLNRYNEAVTSYDKMSNILGLQRQGKHDGGFGFIDQLTFTYSGNKPLKVTDASTAVLTYEGAFQFIDGANVATEYTYDANGNLTQDLNRNLTTITNNVLNLPQTLTFGGGNTAAYTYDAAGNKLSVSYVTAGTPSKTDYARNKVYTNGTLSTVLTGEGYVTFTGTTPLYHYYLKDHLGNNRVVLNQAGTVEQVNHYYPFGGLIGESMAGGVQPYKYNGKELDRTNKLDWYDYGRRMYDPQIGRFHVVDPMAFKHMDYTPYAYCYNNPIKFVDPFGLDTLVFNQNGTYAGNKNIIKAKGEDVGKVLGDDGYVFNFADPKNDSKAVRKGKITQVAKVSDDAIADVLDESGVTDEKNQKNKYTYIRNESNASNLEGEGKMDYVVTAQVKINGVKQPINDFTLYVTTTESGTVGHNNYNFGNFLWGAGAKMLGFGEGTARFGAHLNNFFNDPYHKGTLDSKDDQYSIHLGFEYMYLRW